MSVRVLTIDEMLALLYGTAAVTAIDIPRLGLKVGTTLVRGHRSASADDDESVSFTYGRGSDYDYFFEGEVGVVEPQPTASIETGRTTEELTEELGIFRPDLETRKVGKIPVHMAIDGFPLALFEVSKVMGWAADVKGYKLHDWRNLPEAEIALPSAGYRHMLENSVQKSKGLAAVDRVDHESGLLHLAHQAFNILAEIELVLSGKIE